MARTTTRSEQLFAAAQHVLPGGVNSPVRNFGKVGGTPAFAARGKGALVWDADGNQYTDYLASWGPLILGHADDEVVAAIEEAARDGTSFGMPTAREVEMAELLVDALPSLEMVRVVSSGSEATMSAVRVARGYTGRAKVIKLEGGYHGHVDGLLVKAGSGAATFGVPDSAGVPAGHAGDTVVAPYNDLAAVERILSEVGDQVAALIVEPVAGNMGVVPPVEGFLEGLRTATERHGVVLIFDEVITGFRLGYSGAQGLYGVTPDMTCLGKIIGGGLPVGAFGGKAELMRCVVPLGPVYQAGTLSGNPLAMAAGLATLRRLREASVYRRVNTLGERLAQGLGRAVAEAGVPAHVTGVGSMLTVFFRPGRPRCWAEASACDTQAYARFFHGMLERGMYLAPAQFEAAFVSLAHTEELVDQTIEAAAEALAEL